MSLLDKTAPDFELPSTGGSVFRLSSAAGKPVVIFFYPKDNTPGCTAEGERFRDLHPEFAKLGCAIYGISRDSLKSHEGFKAKFGFPFELLSDAEEQACKAYGVIRLKNMYGKQVRGIERSTFVIGRDGKVAGEWRGVRVPGHPDEILAFVQSLE